MKKFLHNSKLYLIALSNQIYRLTHVHKFTNSITILSSQKWRNKVKEDLILQKYLLHNQIDTKIIAWEKSKPQTKFSIIRSIWGYQHQIDKFTNYIETINKQNKILINDYKIISQNINKANQLELLNKYQIPHISTQIIYDLSEIKTISKYEKHVIKPLISASGNNTHILEDLTEENITNIYQDLVKNGLMIQPFLKEIQNGEISLILINNELTHSIIRYPGLFTTKKTNIYQDIQNLDPNIYPIIEKIKNIKEYQNNAFMRIDLIKYQNTYLVMEIELLEPQLFLEWIPNLEIKNKTYEKFVNAIEKYFKN